MRLKPMGQWFCDACGGVIQDSEQGLLEWQQDDDAEKMSDFAIVHRDGHALPGAGRTCRRPDTAYVGLEDFATEEALGRLLHMISSAPVVRVDRGEPEVKDLGQWAELMRRLMIPHYEEARVYWE